MTAISLENRIAVHELIAEYSHHVDNYRGKEWSELFIEGGKLLGDGIAFEGRPAFIAQAQSLKDGETEYRHSITNVYLESGSDNERAFARAYGLVTDWARTPPLLSIFVEYRFELVKRAGQWKIAEMHVYMPYND